MNLDKILKFSNPFQHWELSDCLDDKPLDEISFATIPEGGRAYDGTRAADHTGKGIDGKLRLFITKKDLNNFPNLINAGVISAYDGDRAAIQYERLTFGISVDEEFQRYSGFFWLDYIVDFTSINYGDLSKIYLPKFFRCGDVICRIS